MDLRAVRDPRETDRSRLHDRTARRTDQAESGLRNYTTLTYDGSQKLEVEYRAAMVAESEEAVETHATTTLRHAGP